MCDGGPRRAGKWLAAGSGEGCAATTCKDIVIFSLAPLSPSTQGWEVEKEEPPMVLRARPREEAAGPAVLAGAFFCHAWSRPLPLLLNSQAE